MNTICVMGRLTHDPEITSATEGTTIARFSVAVDRKFAKEGQQKTDFFNCTAFGKLGEFVERYLKKATKVVIRGEMRLDLVQKDGKNVTYPKINVAEIDFAESKRESDSTTEDTRSENDFLNIPDGLVEELPFS